MRSKRIWLATVLPAACSIGFFTSWLATGAEPRVPANYVPGLGTRVADVGDDFEDAAWSYIYNVPKSSADIDKQVREPGGGSTNGRWLEGAYRGQPDVLTRIETPPGGIPGSKGALLLRSLQTGIPNRPSSKMHQDDIIAAVSSEFGETIDVSRVPSVVVRVYIPPFAQWEATSNASFGFRVSLQAKNNKKGLFRNSSKLEAYWPGFFIYNHRKVDGYEKDAAQIIVRSDEYGQDFHGPEIAEPGWWTLGMTITGDGRVHYFASPGVDDLTPEDFLASHRPYGFKAEQFHTFFFNVVNQDNGRNWSTSWVIDDPALYVQRRQ